jgi:hypothetical protein
MNLYEFLNLRPTLLTIAPTYRCTAACKHCCFRCTPKVEKIMETPKLFKYIDEAVNSFDSLKGVVFTGGECFLINELPNLIKYISQYGLMSRLVSNGYWAKSYNSAFNKLKPLVENGLNELNFSTGDNHQEFVPFENIINGIRAAYDLGIRTLCVNIETNSNSNFNHSEFKNNTFTSSMIAEGSLLIINGAWMPFNKQNDEYRLTINPFHKLEINNSCKNIFDNIFINPYSQMLSCCGITVEYIPYLKLGNLDNCSMVDLYKHQCNDLFKFWLHVEGPSVIYDKVAEHRNIKKKAFNHGCAYCLELTKDKENIESIKYLLENELSRIICIYKLKNSNLKIVT